MDCALADNLRKLDVSAETDGICRVAPGFAGMLGSYGINRAKFYRRVSCFFKIRKLDENRQNQTDFCR